MKRFAVWVEFEIGPGAVPAFLEAARADAPATEALIASRKATRLAAEEGTSLPADPGRSL